MILDMIILICVIHAWWFVALPFIFVGMWRFPLFVEIIIVGIIYDSLFGFYPEIDIWGYIGTISSVAIFGIMFFIKKILRR
ncbi:MAG: hypothetical protein A3C79_00650 [Candidatus Taylorbacteria bacterium RIFCSPHIGHO2_02_FULL_45_28]|uniref:Uncharacterized protein n=1 Tax=Candidatus Taylorbacteria bacterium RIFCSPHIGHO2_12_FULL_45_16 TaxID=1802315 RepID=A0A1G2MZ83_9BACT|nr:MAG: hypothetical protein A2830_01905 [Candidatus Taylorbacteria bacterium RIFCSPHIGHO2_01_FULL_44_110]OHA25529.1 MAG: hypothetical protein A3C79_00650 [Candidatus Taylorbacteria bacterium RIFCSPHIGHO2_02_FULL_45_28]OHA29196.1 MAG: hypothetical protein A3F51_01115 [Candidatus Taylorbacteria bacterium RIFCSPHIGHO2_12_FULL_45_16]OHA33418.1 MAG: hypothetical protein A3A23_01995 [Candidatus Taylorbacteria bacterium RIFCSPLOWO2_01_FULL_45_59]OHA39502.1 MAG: hypothetical protein A3I98_03965 [Candi